jgi:hypothetical protein
MRLSAQIFATTGWITVAPNHLVVLETPSDRGKQVGFTKTAW